MPNEANDLFAGTPRFRADIVGSFLRPPELKEAHQKRRAQTQASQNGAEKSKRLVNLEDQAIRDVIALQESCGLKVVTDGEFRRSVFFDFIALITGIRVDWVSDQFGFHGGGATPRVNVVQTLEWPEGGITVEDFEFLRQNTDVTPKAMLPSPLTAQFHNLYRDDWIQNDAYDDPSAYWEDMVDVYRKEISALWDTGCTYLQIDETALIKLCDEKYVARLNQAGLDQGDVAAKWIKVLNACISDKPFGMTVAMHMCRGNGPGGHWLAEGGYEPIADAIFNQLDIDVFLLEYDSVRAGGFEPLRYCPEGKGIVLGLVTTKTPELEDPDELKKRIDEASAYVPIERLALSPQCGFASDVEGNPLTVEDEYRKLKLVVDVATDVWGST